MWSRVENDEYVQDCIAFKMPAPDFTRGWAFPQR